MLDPAGRTVMISGANRGVGNAIARQLSAVGYNVSAGGRDIGALTAAMDGCTEERLLCHIYNANHPGSDREWIEATIERFGSLDVLINNAGVVNTAALEELTDEILDELWAVNLKAPLRMIQLALPHLRQSGTGRIVNLSSLSGVRVMGTFAPGYAMTKHAVIALTEATKQAAWDEGVRVTAVCPGYVATDMTSQFGVEADSMVQPEDLADLVVSVIALPNTASVAQLTVACRLEPHF